MQLQLLGLLLAAGASLAQRPAETSICDYYTGALLMNNTAANQMTLLTLLVNTAVIGNYTMPNVGVSVPGILNPNGTFNGTAVNLVPYFSGELASTNNGGAAGESVNFLDGGGAAPLLLNMPAEDNTSKQYALLTHLYQYFGVLLGCTMIGQADFPSYGGDLSMYEVHKFMVLNSAEMGYFITQVALSAASFGVAEADIAAAGTALNGAFNNRCGAAIVVVPETAAAFQSVCTDESCPLAPNSTCDAQALIAAPVAAGAASTSAAGSGTASMTRSATGSASMTRSATGTGAAPSTTAATGGAIQASASVGALLFGLFAALF